MKFLTVTLLSIFLISDLAAQCESWIDSPRKEEAENAHVVYRGYIKNKDYKSAYDSWKVAYDLAPVADGRRDWHFEDGIAIYRDFLQKEREKETPDESKIEEYKNKIMELYEQGAQCIEGGQITYKNCTTPECRRTKVGNWLGMKAIDMYYYLQYPRAETYEVIKEAVRLAGTETSYRVLKPATDIAVYLYQKQKITPEVARQYIDQLTEIADWNIENDEKMKPYYEYEKSLMKQEIAKIESDLYDCAYFVEKLKPRYNEDPENPDNLRYIIATLKKQGCEADEVFLAKVEAEYAVMAEEFNAAQQAEFERKNPSVAAKRCYDEGDYDCAIEKYQEAIEKEEDDEKKANYYFAMASIQFRKLNQYSTARNNARKAAELKSGWGRPYMLIGDMYAKTSSKCGNGAFERGLAVLAAIDKWSYARSIDESVAAEANRNIARYSQYMPPEEDAFMMGKKEGEKETVKCWIGETVSLRFN